MGWQAGGRRKVRYTDRYGPGGERKGSGAGCFSALGRARAKQTRFDEGGPRHILPILLHGDAAFAGQGIAAEVLNLATLRGFSVGGTVHIIVNNLIGFTANPEDLYASRFASDLAKRLPVPILHVNAEDPDAVVRVARLALAFSTAKVARPDM